ncbi:MAG: hypothetical protein JNK82_22010 [Myxococcaceae bacterium]|nr:hypothetical protein [Myxococcaceae bacterium]
MPTRNVMGTLFADSVRMLAERELTCLRGGASRTTPGTRSRPTSASIEVRGISDTDLQLRISHGLSQPAEAGAAYQTVGFLTRLLQHCGAAEVEHALTSASWDSDPHTTLQMT